MECDRALCWVGGREVWRECLQPRMVRRIWPVTTKVFCGAAAEGDIKAGWAASGAATSRGDRRTQRRSRDQGKWGCRAWQHLSIRRRRGGASLEGTTANHGIPFGVSVTSWRLLTVIT